MNINIVNQIMALVPKVEHIGVIWAYDIEKYLGIIKNQLDLIENTSDVNEAFHIACQTQLIVNTLTDKVKDSAFQDLENIYHTISRLGVGNA